MKDKKSKSCCDTTEEAIQTKNNEKKTSAKHFGKTKKDKKK